MMTMGIFITNLSDKELAELILKQDSTFAPMGSGGYAITSPENNKFIFEELDLAPASRFMARIKNGQVWTEDNFSHFFSSLLSTLPEGFTFKKEVFSGPHQARVAFDKLS